MTHPLISAADLKTRLAQANLSADTMVVDCRFNLANTEAGEAAWQQGHIPGALYAHLDRHLSGTKSGRNGRHPLPDRTDFIATLRQWGLTPSTLVVAYDDAGGMFAARLWWMLRWVGHEACAVLDGGWAQWQQADGEVSTSPVASRASSHYPDAEAQAIHPRGLVMVHEVEAALRNGQPLPLIDARAPDRFAGQNETLDPVGGHIPGAVNRFFQLNLAHGLFKSPDQLRQEFIALMGQHDASEVVHQCGSGVTACHNLLAMEVAGLKGSRLYAGSWSEWCADSSRPVAV